MLHAIRERLAIGQNQSRSERRAARRNTPANAPQDLGGENSAQSFARRRRESAAEAPARAPRSARLRLDVPLLLILITLVIYGLIMLYSSSYDYSRTYYKDSAMMFNRQLLWLAIGIVSLIGTTLMDYHKWNRLVLPALILTSVALIGTLINNQLLNNAVRTLYGRSVQASELAKLVMILYLAVWLFAKRERLHDISFGLLPLSLLLGLVCSAILLQPDLSAAVTIMFLGGVMFFLAGGDLKQIGLLLFGAALVGYFVLQFNPTGSTRISEYVAGLINPEGASYHVQRAMEAFVKGGFLGTGIGKSVTKLTGLPVPPTDSVFAVIGEETGLVGSIALVFMYVLLLWRGLTIAQRAPDQLGALIAAGISLWIAFEAFINMAVMVNVLPFAGNALPFISAGGSNLVVTLTAIGILLNVSRVAVEETENRQGFLAGRFFGAVTDLRRRDRRRRVSRSERPAGLD